MKKMRLVCIILGVFLILAGMMSGVALAQPTEEPAYVIPDYENFPFQEHYTIDRDNDGEADIVIEYYTRSKITELRDEQTMVITLKDVITIEKGSSSAIELLLWVPEISIDIDKATNHPDLESLNLDHLRSTMRYAVKENGQWRFVDEQIFRVKSIEFMKGVGLTDEEIKELAEENKQSLK